MTTWPINPLAAEHDTSQPYFREDLFGTSCFYPTSDCAWTFLRSRVDIPLRYENILFHLLRFCFSAREWSALRFARRPLLKYML